MHSYDQKHNWLQIQHGKYGVTESVAEALRQKKMLARGGRVKPASGVEADRDRFVKAILKG